MLEYRVLQRQRKGEKKFDASMHKNLVNRLLLIEPLASFQVELSNSGINLGALLLTESRLRYLSDGDSLFHYDDYGDSCFLLLSGSIVSYVVSNPVEAAKSRSKKTKKTWLSALSQLLDSHAIYEKRQVSDYLSSRELFMDAEESNITLVDHEQDWKHYLDYAPGELIGHISASARTPRYETIIAKGNVEVLEFKWQALREIKRYSKGMQAKLESDYRTRGLEIFLNTLPEFFKIDSSLRAKIISYSFTQSLGNPEWNRQLRSFRQDALSAELDLPEFTLANKGDYAENIYIVRSGFVLIDDGQQQVYKTQGDLIGLDQISLESNIWLYDIKAQLFAEVICVSRKLFDSIDFAVWPKSYGHIQSANRQAIDRLFGKNLFVNGRQTMLINLDRCTECDDCVSGCASAHGGNPRFVRQGPVVEKFMVANACMHCKDPVCLIGCPTGAIRRKPDGEVVINDQSCIGCSTCANSCPYDNIKMVNIVDELGRLVIDEEHKPIIKASKCDLCYDQLTGPACVNACPNDALKRVDIDTIHLQARKWLA